VKFTNKQLKTFGKEHKKGLRKLSYKLYNDIEETANSNSLMLDAINGNKELMLTMLALNKLKNLETFGDIREVRVVNPQLASGISASNEELLYSIKKIGVKLNLENIDKIHFLNKVEILRARLKEI